MRWGTHLGSVANSVFEDISVFRNTVKIGFYENEFPDKQLFATEPLEIMNLADSVLVVLNPGWGDSIQANKAGLTEAGDVFTINKADKPGVELTRKDLLESLALLANRPAPEVVQTISTTGEGVEYLWQTIMSHRERLQAGEELLDLRAEKRRKVVRKLIADQLVRMLEDTLDTEFGKAVLEDTIRGEIDIDVTVERLLQRF